MTRSEHRPRRRSVSAALALTVAFHFGATLADDHAPPKPGFLPPGQPGRIAFANQRDGILNWQADGEKGIWVQAPSRQWYYGKFMSPCIGLDFVDSRLGFDTEPNGDFDQFSFVEVPGEFHERCQLTSLVTSNGPPTAKERKAAKAAAAAAASASASAAPPASH